MAEYRKMMEADHHRFRKQEEIAKTHNAGDGEENWLARKDKIDKWNHAYISDHRRINADKHKDNAQLNELRELAIRENARKRRETQASKQEDQQVVQNLVANERQQRYEEYCRRQAKNEILQNAYHDQMHERKVIQQIEKDIKDHEAKGTTFMTGSINQFGNRNYDLRDEIAEKNRNRYENFVQTKQEEQELVAKMGHYDAVVSANERQREYEKQRLLNNEYNQQKQRIEETKKIEKEAKRNVRPRVYGEI